jgi:hypothetical protein
LLSNFFLGLQHHLFELSQNRLSNQHSMQVDKTAGQMILTELLNYGLNVQVGISVKAFGDEWLQPQAYIRTKYARAIH